MNLLKTYPYNNTQYYGRTIYIYCILFLYLLILTACTKQTITFITDPGFVYLTTTTTPQFQTQLKKIRSQLRLRYNFVTIDPTLPIREQITIIAEQQIKNNTSIFFFSPLLSAEALELSKNYPTISVATFEQLPYTVPSNITGIKLETDEAYRELARYLIIYHKHNPNAVISIFTSPLNTIAIRNKNIIELEWRKNGLSTQQLSFIEPFQNNELLPEEALSKIISKSHLIVPLLYDNNLPIISAIPELWHGEIVAEFFTHHKYMSQFITVRASIETPFIDMNAALIEQVLTKNKIPIKNKSLIPNYQIEGPNVVIHSHLIPWIPPENPTSTQITQKSAS